MRLAGVKPWMVGVSSPDVAVERWVGKLGDLEKGFKSAQVTQLGTLLLLR